MPKQSKISSTRPTGTMAIRESPVVYKCCRCDKHFNKQKTNFPASQSLLYRANGGYLPICYHCVEELCEHYKNVLEDERQAVRRVCSKFDIYWNERIYDMATSRSSQTSRIRAYISKANLKQFIGKTFDDTLDEESHIINSPEDIEAATDNTDVEISADAIDFWGGGFTPDFYNELDRRYRHWTKDLDNIDVGAEGVYKQICIQEALINKGIAEGDKVDRNVNLLNSLLESAKIKPVQKKDEEDVETSIDTFPFGVGIKMLEEQRPVKEVDPDFEDVDGIRKYITVWFFGHLCHMLKIKNSYCRAYEEEIERLKVEKPDFDEDEDFDVDDIFESDGV